jgi:uncharacterized protein YecE (DUF72 family)
MAFLDGLPKDFTYGVEVRHPSSSPKGPEQQLNRGLHERNVNRVILDSRPVQRCGHQSGDDRRAKKKPKVPVHAVMTARQPMVRFIGGDDMAHRELFRVWLQTLPKWHQSGTPWLFLHTPDIAYAPAGRCGAICAPPCRRQEMRRRFRSNLLFSDILLS